MWGEKWKSYHIVSEYSKQAQNEFKTRHSWVGKVIYWELCKGLDCDHTTKLYMNKPESILGNETHKILRYFETKTDHLILTKISVSKQEKKRTWLQLDFLWTKDWTYKKTKR